MNKQKVRSIAVTCAFLYWRVAKLHFVQCGISHPTAIFVPFLGSGLKYYINGDLSGSQINPSSYSHENNYNDFRIAKSGSDQNAYGSTLQMKFDQLATWSRILNSQEIQIAFNQGRLKNFKPLGNS